MKSRFWLISLIALLTLTGCSSYSIVSDYDRAIPFDNYKSYRWDEKGGTDNNDDLLAKNPLIYKHIKAAVDRELAARGFLLKESGPSDFTISTQATVRERAFIEPAPGIAWSSGYYNRWGRRGYTAIWYPPYHAVSYYDEGTLIIDITDGKTNEIAWRGVASGLLNNYTSSERIHREIDEVVTKILKRFPPQIK